MEWNGRGMEGEETRKRVKTKEMKTQLKTYYTLDLCLRDFPSCRTAIALTPASGWYILSTRVVSVDLRLETICSGGQHNMGHKRASKNDHVIL